MEEHRSSGQILHGTFTASQVFISLPSLSLPFISSIISYSLNLQELANTIVYGGMQASEKSGMFHKKTTIKRRGKEKRRGMSSYI